MSLLTAAGVVAGCGQP